MSDAQETDLVDPKSSDPLKMRWRCAATEGHEGGGNPEWDSASKTSCPSCGKGMFVEMIGPAKED